MVCDLVAGGRGAVEGGRVANGVADSTLELVNSLLKRIEDLEKTVEDMR